MCQTRWRFDDIDDKADIVNQVIEKEKLCMFMKTWKNVSSQLWGFEIHITPLGYDSCSLVQISDQSARWVSVLTCYLHSSQRIWVGKHLGGSPEVFLPNPWRSPMSNSKLLGHASTFQLFACCLERLSTLPNYSSSVQVIRRTHTYPTLIDYVQKSTQILSSFLHSPTLTESHCK